MASIVQRSSFNSSHAEIPVTRDEPLGAPLYLPVERVHKLSYEQFLKDFERPSKPVVIEGAVEGWNALSTWTHKWFKQNYGERPVPVAVGPRLESRLQWMRLGDFIDRIESKEAGRQEYLRQYPVLDAFPELAYDFTPPIYCKPDRQLTINLWLGPGDTVQPLHKDNHNPIALIHNLLVQVAGRKRVLLVSGDQDRLMYQRSQSSKDYHYSQVDVEQPDFERFPLFRNAIINEATINPGEIIFIPGNTWHYVRSLDPSISISFWWHPAKIVDLIARLAGARSRADVTPIVAKYSSGISQGDVDEIGGIRVLVKAIHTLPPHLRLSAYELCDANIRREIQHFRY